FSLLWLQRRALYRCEYIRKGLHRRVFPPADSHCCCFVPFSSEFSQGVHFFARRNALTVVLFKKKRLRVMDWSITLRLWNMNRLISCVGLAAAREVHFSKWPQRMKKAPLTTKPRSRNRSSTNGSEIDTRQLLSALMELKRGDFSARLPEDLTGVAGKIADM